MHGESVDCKISLIRGLISWSRILLEKLTVSVGNEIPNLLWSQKVNFRLHKSLPLIHILNHMNPFKIFISSI
jgi:hypothetical protein